MNAYDPERGGMVLQSRVRPRPVVRLNRKVVGAILGSLALALLLAIKLGGQASRARADTEQEPQQLQRYMARPAGLSDLPADYDQVPRPKTPVVQHLPGSVPQPQSEPSVQRVEVPTTPSYRQAPVSDAKREAEAARQSGLFFQSSPRPQRHAGSKFVSPYDSGTQTGRGLSSDSLAVLGALAQKPEPQTRDPNRQADKETFLRQAGQADVPIYLGDRIHDPVSPYLVQAGTLIPAVLITGINSDLPGMLTAQVREPVYDSVSGQSLLIPQGTRLLGQYDSKIVYGQRRVLVAWHRLIMPDGSSIRLEGMQGIDLAGYAGFSDKVNNHWGRIFGSVILSSVLSVGARLPAGTVSNDRGVSPGEQFALEASANFNRVGQDLVRKNLDIQPTLEIRPGYAMNILVHKDMVMRPYDLARDRGEGIGYTSGLTPHQDRQPAVRGTEMNSP